MNTYRWLDGNRIIWSTKSYQVGEWSPVNFVNKFNRLKIIDLLKVQIKNIFLLKLFKYLFAVKGK